MNREIKGKNVLVTGGAGFVGSHLVERLAEDNKVIVLDNLLYGSLENLKDIKHIFIKDDIIDADIAGIMSEYDVDLVFHLASYHLDHALKDPMKDFLITGLGGMRVVEACRHHKIKRLVFTSTGSVYGEPKYKDHSENHQLLPTTPYGISKTAIDHYCRVYNDIYDVETVRLRYYNIYGPRRTAGAIPQFILKALRGDEIWIFGGEQTRTPTYVSDIVEATYRAGWMEGIEGQAYNIAASKYISIMELAKMIVRLCNAEDRVSFRKVDYRPGEIIHLRPNINLARTSLGWEAAVTLEEGLLRLIDYLKKDNTPK